MLPSSLQEIFGTLAVGILAAVVLIIAIWVLQADTRGLRVWFRQQFLTPPPNTSVLAIVFLLLFGFGVVIENITDHLTDSEPRHYFESLWWPPKLQAQLLQPERYHRFETLSYGCHETTLASCKLRGVGKAIFNNHKDYVEAHVFSQEQKSFAESPVDYLRGKTKGAPADFAERRLVAEKFSNNIYYTAKNWAYTQSTHYDELQSIQRHIEYTRSSFLIASFGILMIVATLIGSPVWWRSFPRGKGNAPATYPVLQQLKRGVGSMAVLAVFSFFAWQGYAHSEINFNERAFGYYISHLDQEEKARRAKIPPSEHPALRANQWMQTAAEYAAITIQTYNQALDRVRQRMTDAAGKWPKRPAVVLDLDETVIDNGYFQNYLMWSGSEYTTPLWKEWVREGILEAGFVPGAEKFIRSVEKLGVTVIYLSNRPDSPDERQATIETLKRLDVNTDGLEDKSTVRLLLKKDQSDKEERRSLVKQKYQIIALIGDNLGDFASGFNEDENLTVSSRRQAVEADFERWGREWFVLPNPMYGNWKWLLDPKDPMEYLKPWRP